MQTRKIDTSSRKDVNRWVDFPYRLYKDHPYWVPMLKSGVRNLLDKNKHPYYQHSEADFFVVEDKGEVVAKVCAMENTLYNQYFGVGRFLGRNYYGGSYSLGWSLVEEDWAGGVGYQRAGSISIYYAEAWVVSNLNLAAMVVANAAGRTTADAAKEAIEKVGELNCSW